MQLLHHPQRCKHGLCIRLEHHRVSSHDRREGVRHRERQRVVPRCDDPDYADRIVLHPRGSQQRNRAAPTFGCQHFLPCTRVVARGDQDIGEFLRGRRAGLTGLELHDVQALGSALIHQIVKPQQHPGSVRQRGRRPDRGVAAGDAESNVHIFDIGDRKRRQERAIERRHPTGVAVAARRRHTGRQQSDQIRRHHLVGERSRGGRRHACIDRHLPRVGQVDAGVICAPQSTRVVYVG